MTAGYGRSPSRAASSNGTIGLWDLDEGSPVGKPLTGHNGGVIAVAFGMTRGRRLLLASGGDDQAVRLWDPADSAPSRRGRRGSLLAAAASAAGTPPLASVG